MGQTQVNETSLDGESLLAWMSLAEEPVFVLNDSDSVAYQPFPHPSLSFNLQTLGYARIPYPRTVNKPISLRQIRLLSITNHIISLYPALAIILLFHQIFALVLPIIKLIEYILYPITNKHEKKIITVLKNWRIYVVRFPEPSVTLAVLVLFL